MKVSRQAAAAEQIDQAIRSLFKNLIVSSVTLAGAAETLLVDNGKSGGVLFFSMKKQGEKRTGIPQSQLANEHFNKLRNWLKHL
jgi:hypothetical protein